eukprot:RCo023057
MLRQVGQELVLLSPLLVQPLRKLGLVGCRGDLRDGDAADVHVDPTRGPPGEQRKHRRGLAPAVSNGEDVHRGEVALQALQGGRHPLDPGKHAVLHHGQALLPGKLLPLRQLLLGEAGAFREADDPHREGHQPHPLKRGADSFLVAQPVPLDEDRALQPSPPPEARDVPDELLHEEPARAQHPHSDGHKEHHQEVHIALVVEQDQSGLMLGEGIPGEHQFQPHRSVHGPRHHPPVEVGQVTAQPVVGTAVPQQQHRRRHHRHHAHGDRLPHVVRPPEGALQQVQRHRQGPRRFQEAEHPKYRDGHSEPAAVLYPGHWAQQPHFSLSLLGASQARDSLSPLLGSKDRRKN